MFTLFKNLKIGTKIILGFLTIALVVGVVGWIGFFQIRNLKQAEHIIKEERALIMNYASHATMFSKKAEYHCLEYTVLDDPKIKEECYAKLDSVQEKIDKMQALTAVAAHSKRATQLNAMQGYLEDAKRLINKMISDWEIDKIAGSSAHKANIIKVHKSFKAFGAEANDLADYVLNHIIEDRAIAQKAADTGALMIIGFSIIGVVLATTFGLYISKRITKPIGVLHQGVEIIRKGNLDYNVATDTKDEIGQLSRAFDKMTDSLKKSRANVEKQVKERTAQLERLNKAMTGRELKMIELKKRIQELEKNK